MENTTNNTNTMETTPKNEVNTGTKSHNELILEMLEVIGKNQQRIMELEEELKQMTDARGKVDAYEDNAFSMLRTIARMLSNQVGTQAVMDAVVESVNGDTAHEYMTNYAKDCSTAIDIYELASKCGHLEELAEMMEENGHTKLDWEQVEDWLGDNSYKHTYELLRMCDTDEMVEYVFDNCHSRDLIERIDGMVMIDYVFDNCSEHELFDRVQSFIADLDDTKFRKIING